jgi:hypothetical protein
MALAGALGVMVHAVSGFTNKSLRSLRPPEMPEKVSIY